MNSDYGDVRVNAKQVKRVAELIKISSNMDDAGLDFSAPLDMYPEEGHPQALNFFFFGCLHDFGFWYGDHKGYVNPLTGYINGRAKGSTLMWKALKRALDRNPYVFEPKNLALISPAGLAHEIFSDANGPIPFPDFEMRFAMTRAYGEWFFEQRIRPIDILFLTNQNKRALNAFLEQMKCLFGFDKDLLQKRQILLAMILANRPEHFLKVNDPRRWRPIVDYHMMRVALRLGLIEVSHATADMLRNRHWMNEYAESTVRQATYDAVKMLIEKSGRSMFGIDKLLWSARRYCPEMTEPECEKCVFNDVCAKRTELFQPVFRTTTY